VSPRRWPNPVVYNSRFSSPSIACLFLPPTSIDVCRSNVQVCDSSVPSHPCRVDHVRSDNVCDYGSRAIYNLNKTDTRNCTNHRHTVSIFLDDNLNIQQRLTTRRYEHQQWLIIEQTSFTGCRHRQGDVLHQRCAREVKSLFTPFRDLLV
jgi:hypothetical protein